MRDAELQLVAELACSRTWRDAAACGDEDPELFFPIGQGAAYELQVAEAKAVCARCPVRARCLQDALDRGIDDGVFGGLDADERRALKRRPGRQRRPAQPPSATGEHGVPLDGVSLARQSVDQADVEDWLRGLPVVLTGAEKREVARRLFAAGQSRTAISTALRLSGATVNTYLQDAEQAGRAAL
jgi:WhiB family transcriptional regulator, redox-sensing transcriptional regulator